MLKNYLRTAWRNLRAHKFYSLINMGGLAISLATAILLLLWVKDEKSYDKFHKDYQNIYQITARVRPGEAQTAWYGVPGPLAAYARAMPRVVSLVRINEDLSHTLANRDRSRMTSSNRMAFADSTFFSIFDFKLLEGDRHHLFTDSHSVVVTVSLARKLFNSADALGQIVDFQGNQYTVTGVLADFPRNSTLRFDALFPMSVYARRFTEQGGNGDWKTIDTDPGNFSFTTFVKLKAGADPAVVAAALTKDYRKGYDLAMKTRFQLENLGDLHLITPDGDTFRLQMVRIFFTIALLLLIIAAINYVNLSTARALVRLPEVRIRKITGATRLQLFLQFFSETVLLLFISAAVAFGLIVAGMPLYNSLSGKQLAVSWSDVKFWKIIAFSILGTLGAAGIYPALLLSSFYPLRSHKGKSGTASGTALFRKILVVFQFSISVILVIATLVIGLQMHYIRTKSLGYDKSYVFSVPLPPMAMAHVDAIKNALAGNPSIIGAGLSNFYDFSAYDNRTSDIGWPGKPASNNLIIGQAVVDKDFIPTMRMQFLEGRNFTGMPADSSYYIINEEAVKEMGLRPPYVGQAVTFHGHNGTILGVLKDFNFKSLKDRITPILLSSGRFKGNILFLRARGGGIQEAIAGVEKQYNQYAGGIPFSYHFLNKQLAGRYESDLRTGQLFDLFAVIAIFISCLGLLGLAAYTVRVRNKEIGVRKVLGASVRSLMHLLGSEFILLVMVAIAVAVPIAFYGMNRWLEDFAYKIGIRWWVFVVAGLFSTLIAFVTVSVQTWRAATENPVKSLRSE